MIAIEACGASHHWARLLQSFGHTVKLIAPQLVKPYVKRGKNDAADAEALCEAMSRPTMRFVPVKTAEQQAALMLVGVRDRLIRNRTQLANAIRGYAGEFGLTAAKGMAHLDPLLERIQADREPAELGAGAVRGPGQGICAAAGTNRRGRCQAHGLASRRRMQPTSRQDSRRRPDRCGAAENEDPGARAIPIGTPVRGLDRLNAEGSFDCGQGQARRDHSCRRRGIAQRAGGWGYLRHPACSRGGKASPWLAELLKRKSPKLAAVALANKIARIAWKLMVTGENYAAKSASAARRAQRRDQPDTGSNSTATVLSRCQNLQGNEQMV